MRFFLCRILVLVVPSFHLCSFSMARGINYKCIEIEHTHALERCHNLSQYLSNSLWLHSDGVSDWGFCSVSLKRKLPTGAFTWASGTEGSTVWASPLHLAIHLPPKIRPGKGMQLVLSQCCPRTPVLIRQPAATHSLSQECITLSCFHSPLLTALRSSSTCRGRSVLSTLIGTTPSSKAPGTPCRPSPK